MIIIVMVYDGYRGEDEDETAPTYPFHIKT